MSGVSCKEFRALLERALRGHPAHGVPPELGWHEHLLACSACRELLDSEEALEAILATLPEPKLPHQLAERVLALLVSAREASGSADELALDRLLELDAAATAPAGLGERVLSGLVAARHEQGEEQRLERLLELVAEPAIPPQLADRVLDALEEARRPAPRLRLLRGGPARLAAAAALLLCIGLWLLWTLGDRSRSGPGEGTPVATGDGVEEELLASLELLENWELLTSTEVDDLLADFDALDEELLELEEEG
jgi:hypothetical protein